MVFIVGYVNAYECCAVEVRTQNYTLAPPLRVTVSTIPGFTEVSED